MGSALVDTYGNVVVLLFRHRLEVFENLSGKTVVAWNSMIAG